MVICQHCTLKALLAGKEPETFDEEPAEHLARVHPDRAATELERAELVRQVDERRAMASAARMN